MKNLVNYHGHKATSHDCDNVLLLLDDYECVSGQQINKNKTTMRHIKIALEYRKFSNMRNTWGCHPLWEGRKKASFNNLKERIWRKLQGWEEQLLSHAGREVLIKSIVQVILTYTMGCFKLSIGLCKEIEVLIKNFW